MALQDRGNEAAAAGRAEAPRECLTRDARSPQRPAGRQAPWRVACVAAALAALAAPAACALDEVPFITTPDNVTLEMLRLADVGRDDFVIDLGSGDGRIVIVAAQRFGARGLGVEYVPDLVAKSRENARRAGVESRVEFRTQDLFATDLTKASVITLYLLTEVNLQLRPRLLALRPGTRIVSHDWEMGDWPPDRTLTVDAPDKKIGREKLSRLHLWTVPARIAGRWCGPGGTPVGIEQRFGTARAEVGGGAARHTLTGTLHGARVALADGRDTLVLDDASPHLRVASATGRFAAWKGHALTPTASGSCRPGRPLEPRAGWHTASPMREPRAAHAVVATAAAIYALGGTGRGGAAGGEASSASTETPGRSRHGCPAPGSTRRPRWRITAAST